MASWEVASAVAMAARASPMCELSSSNDPSASKIRSSLGLRSPEYKDEVPASPVLV
ncbi:MAG: hypothetical protein Q8P67_23445 [archaeon]|nr:hypothetical protein [archaeon]